MADELTSLRDELERLASAASLRGEIARCDDCGHRAHLPHVCQRDHCDCSTVEVTDEITYQASVELEEKQ